MTNDSKGQKTDSSLAQADSCKLKPFDSSLLHLPAIVNHCKQESILLLQTSSVKSAVILKT